MQLRIARGLYIAFEGVDGLYDKLWRPIPGPIYHLLAYKENTKYILRNNGRQNWFTSQELQLFSMLIFTYWFNVINVACWNNSTILKSIAKRLSILAIFNQYLYFDFLILVQKFLGHKNRLLKIVFQNFKGLLTISKQAHFICTVFIPQMSLSLNYIQPNSSLWISFLCY